MSKEDNAIEVEVTTVFDGIETTETMRISKAKLDRLKSFSKRGLSSGLHTVEEVDKTTENQ